MPRFHYFSDLYYSQEQSQALRLCMEQVVSLPTGHELVILSESVPQTTGSATVIGPDEYRTHLYWKVMKDNKPDKQLVNGEAKYQIYPHLMTALNEFIQTHLMAGCRIRRLNWARSYRPAGDNNGGSMGRHRTG